MLKSYMINGKEWQFEEGKQPKDAIELRRETDNAESEHANAESKAAKPANKARKAATK